MASPNVPEVIGGYRVLEVLSVGGMGTVYRARDLKIGRDVAIKLLRKELDDQGVRESFAREARPVSRLNHRNIVTIFEIGEHNGLPFIAMEYVHGETLASFLRRHPPVTLSRKLQIMEQICSGLEYAHRMGVVHRDIKPANIMIDDEGTPKILDFGMARMGRSKNTQAGQITGTLNYMAPEQITGMAADSRGDVFSIGAVFYELLSYRKAFPGDTPSTIIHEVLYRQPEPLEILDPNLDPALISTVTRCLEKQPEVRHADLGAVRKALVAVSHRLQSAEHQVDSEPYPTTSMPVPAPYAWSAETPPPSRSRKDSVEQVRGRADQTRAKQLQSHLDVAEDALDQGDCEGALEACEQALILDPTSPQALDLETRARAALDRLLEERLAAARAEFDRSALTAAELLTDQVLAIKPDSAEAIQIRHHIERARLRLVEERERERERQRALDQACAEAELHLTAGALDSAAQAIERALSFDAGSRDALALKERITAATAAVREARHRADVEWKRHEAEAEHQRLAADAARLAQESAARSKLEAEVERRKQEAEMDRRRFEAETGRLKRDAEGERLKREAEAQRRAAEAKALDSEAEGSPPPFMEVTVFYGTDRAKIATGYGPDRGSMQYGTSVVSVPTGRKIGSIPRPTIWTLFRQKREKHFVLTDVVELNKSDFIASLRRRIGSSEGKEALVFVHGFNVEFRDAVYRTAQITADLQFPGAAILFSWPSKGVLTPLGYTHDEEQARWALPDLREFLELIVEQSGAETIHLLAHSMGNRVLTEALSRLGTALTHTPALFHEAILTAPDIDADTFVKDLVPAILPTSKRITLYASSGDRALAFSKTVHGYRRAGDSGDDITLCEGIDTIDVSSVDTNFVGHFYYGDNRSVLSDLFNLIKGHPATRRFGLLARYKGNRRYWVFQP